MFGVFVLLALLLTPSSSPCSTPEEEYKKVQKELQEKKQKLSEAQEKEHSVLSEIEDVNKKLSRIEGELRSYRRRLNETEAEISAVDADIEKTQKGIEQEKDWIRRKLRIMYKFGYSGDILSLLLSADDISQVMRVWKYLESVTRYEHKVLSNYRQDLKTLDEKNRKLQSLKSEFKTQTAKVKSKENELADKRRDKEAILASVRTEKASYQKMLGELKEASQRLLDIIKKSAKADDYAATGFGKQKGRFAWPADGKIAIPYGSQRDPQFDMPVFRNGIHIQTAPNAEARAVGSGKVIFAEWFKGFGQLIIINHGSGYHTLYGNLSEIFSHIGDIIKEGQVIGRVGTSGLLNAPGLYFEVRYKGKPLDPVQWLGRKKR